MYQEKSYGYEYQQTNFITKVYGWMSLALAVTAVTAWYIASQPTFYNLIAAQPFLLLLICLAQLGLVVALTAMLDKMSYATAITLFLIYAFSLGVTMSLILQMYTVASIASTFVVTAGMFGGMSLYGYYTKSDLTNMQNLLIMVLWGLVLSMLVNMFLKSVWFDYIISMIGVVVFAFLTATDTQKLKQLGERLFGNEQTRAKAAVVGALMLYLDFINLFLFLLRFTGNRRDQ